MFGIQQRGSTVGREALGGVTTFMAMSYILFVQPAVLAKAGMDTGGVFMATCISSAAACVLMGLLANYPIALAPGMGENFFFVFTLCGVGAAAGAFRLSWQEALALTAIAGTVFLLLSLVGFRAHVLNAIPDALKSGIAAGIGLFIALIGFEWGNLAVHDEITCLKLAGMKGNYVAALTLAGLAVTLALLAFRVRGAILLGILITTAATWSVGHVWARHDLGLAVEGVAEGVKVTGITLGSAAAQASLIEKGDVVARFHGREVRSGDELLAAWRAAEETPAAEVPLIRAGRGLRVWLPLRTAGAGPELGLTVQPHAQGVRVTSVSAASGAAQAGLVEGDVLVKFDGRAVGSGEELVAAWRAAEGVPAAEVQLVRAGRTLMVWQPLDIETIKFRGVVGIPHGVGRTAGRLWSGFGKVARKVFSSDWIHVLAFAFILLFMDLFDTVGTLVGVSKRAGLVTDGKLPRAERALAADAAGTVIGAGLGTSTVTSYIESITGVASGARTGLAAVVAGGCMLLALLFQPVVEMVGGGIRMGWYAWGDPILRYPMIAPALIVVGAMMMRAVRDVNWEDMTESLPAFLAMIAMPFAYSISAGIAIGFVSYAFGKLVTGRVRECPIIVYVFAVLFVVQYLFVMP